MTSMNVTQTEAAYVAEGTTQYFLDDAELKAQGIALSASFPKSTRVGLKLGMTTAGRKYYYLAFDAKLSADAANGGVNETGMKRISSFERAAAKLGVELVK